MGDLIIKTCSKDITLPETNISPENRQTRPNRKFHFPTIHFQGQTCCIRFREGIWLFPKNRGTPKSSILIGFSIINHPFLDTPIFGNTHIGTNRIELRWLIGTQRNFWDVGGTLRPKLSHAYFGSRGFPS